MLIAVDTAMTGQYNTTELAYYALAQAPQMPMVLFGIGMMMGTMVFTARAMGAGDTVRSGHVWRASLSNAVVFGTLGGIACQFSAPALRALGQSESLSAGAAPVVAIFGLGMPAMFLFAATSFFLEAAGRPKVGMVVMLIANLANVVLNWVLIFGHAGFPAMGAQGAAIATTIVRWLMFLGLAGFAVIALDSQRFGLRGPNPHGKRLARELRGFGYPMGIAHAMESAAFSSLTVFAGWLGVVALASYQLAINLAATVFMCAIGFSAAASIRVANAIGRDDRAGVSTAGWVAVGLGAAWLAVIAVAIAIAPEFFGRIYTSDKQVLAVAAPTLLMAAVALLPDGVQGVLIGALRGVGDVWPATIRYLIAFWGVMVPTAYLLGVDRNLGAPGLMLSIAIGASVACVLLAIRFHHVSTHSA